MGADSSNEPKPGSPRFLKVVRNPSAPHLILPIAFVREYFDKIPKNPKLKTATGEHSWRLQIKKIGEDYCFVDGRERLAKDAELCIRDIIVFWLIDTFTFQVLFFDEHGCEKDLPLKEIGDGDGDGDGDGGGVSVTRDEDLYFQKVISWKTISINWYKWDKNAKHLKPGTGLLQLREGLKVFANLICSTTVSRCFKVLI